MPMLTVFDGMEIFSDHHGGPAAPWYVEPPQDGSDLPWSPLAALVRRKTGRVLVVGADDPVPVSVGRLRTGNSVDEATPRDLHSMTVPQLKAETFALFLGSPGDWSTESEPWGPHRASIVVAGCLTGAAGLAIAGGMPGTIQGLAGAEIEARFAGIDFREIAAPWAIAVRIGGRPRLPQAVERGAAGVAFRIVWALLADRQLHLSS